MNIFLFGIPTLVFFFFLTSSTSLAQSDGSVVSVSDVENFWIAFDSVQTTNDPLKQLDFVQRLYIDKGTKGLKAFMKLRNFDADRLLKTIQDYPRFWQTVRPNTLRINEQEKLISEKIQTFKTLYPDYREAQVFFTITAVRSGGTFQDNMVLIGTEIAVGNEHTDVSEFPDKRLATFFKTQKQDNIVPFVIHEYVHTQQISKANNLLGHAIFEGACDFITELVLDHTLEHAYLQYGRIHEETLKKQFEQEMFGEDYQDWLYNGDTSDTVGDLGYFMGYAICKSYYENASNKELAIKEIIELDYADATALNLFLTLSRYYE